MTADSYSARVGLIEMATGNNNNNWGTIFNTSFADLLDRTLWGTDTHAVTGGALDLSAGTLPPLGPSPVAGAIQAFTGVLTSNETVTFPSLGGKWTVFNNTTGAFSLLLKTSGMATPIQIPQGAFVDVICDGTTLFRRDGNQVGRVVYDAASVSAGTLELDGSSLLRANYPDLFTKIGTAYGTVDGTHFTLPNLKDTGRFLRSRSGSITLGTSQSNQNKTHTHTGSGVTSADAPDHAHIASGTTSTDSPDHTHPFTVTGTLIGPGVLVAGGGSFFGPNTTNGNTGGASARHTHTYNAVTSGITANHFHTYSFTTSTGSADGAEARPEALAMIACILY